MFRKSFVFHVRFFLICFHIIKNTQPVTNKLYIKSDVGSSPANQETLVEILGFLKRTFPNKTETSSSTRQAYSSTSDQSKLSKVKCFSCSACPSSFSLAFSSHLFFYCFFIIIIIIFGFACMRTSRSYSL